jgi:hypothetical protein
MKLFLKLIFITIMMLALIVYGYKDLMLWLGVNKIVSTLIGYNVIPVLLIGGLMAFGVWCLLASKGSK